LFSFSSFAPSALDLDAGCIQEFCAYGSVDDDGSFRSGYAAEWFAV
jgi:hypothetical protein